MARPLYCIIFDSMLRQGLGQDHICSFSKFSHIFVFGPVVTVEAVCKLETTGILPGLVFRRYILLRMYLAKYV